MRKENRIRITSVLRKIYVMLLALCLSSLLLSVTVKAAEKRIVRVAFFPMDGFHMVMEDGSFGGMDVLGDRICTM